MLEPTATEPLSFCPAEEISLNFDGKFIHVQKSGMSDWNSCLVEFEGMCQDT